MNSKEHIPQLNDQEYSKVFHTFVTGSTQYKDMPMLAKPAIDHFSGKTVNLLSIGAGTGMVEDHFVKNFDLKLSYYYAIEPNEFHRLGLKKTIHNWNVDHKIDSDYFTPRMEINDRFDIVLMSHCLYYMEDPLGAMLKAKSLAKPQGGKVIIFHHTDESASVFRHLRKSATPDRSLIIDRGLSSKELSRMLDKSGIKHDVSVAHSIVDVDDFIEERNTPTANDVITFILQTRFEDLKEDLKNDVFCMTKEMSFKNKDGKHVLAIPTAMIQIEN